MKTKIIFSILLLSFFTFYANATIINWNGGNGRWNVANNWAGGVIPILGDQAIILSGQVKVPSNYIANVESITVAAFATLIVNNNAILNIEGDIDLLYGIHNSGKVINKGEINIDKTQRNAILNINSDALFNNKLNGVINIGQTNIYSTAVSIIYGSTFNNKGLITIYNADSNGIIASESIINNTGTIDVDYTLYAGLSIVASTILINEGIINIENSGTYGLMNTDSDIDNDGEISVNNSTLTAIWNYTGSTFNNTSCALIISDGAIINDADFENDGLIRQDYDGSNVTGADFVNNGIVEDIQGSFIESSITNNGYYLGPILGSVVKYSPVTPFFLGAGSGLTVTNNKVYLDSGLLQFAGNWIPNTNSWWPTTQAVGSDVFYVEIDNGNGCPVIIETHLENTVSSMSRPNNTLNYAATNFTESNVSLSPSHREISIKGIFNSETPLEAILVNINGQKVFQKEFDQIENKMTLLENTSKYFPGAYFLIVKQNNQLLIREKVVIY